MDKELEQRHFITCLILLIRVQMSVKDRFYYAKLKDHIRKLTSEFLKFQVGEGSSSSQSVYADNFISRIDNILELLQDLSYLKMISVSPLFLQTNRSLLILKLEGVRRKHSIGPVKKNSSPDTKTSDLPLAPRAVKSSPKIASKLNKSKQKILGFIRSYPNIRTKDIIHEFSALSDRTVKRNLTDLLHSGLIKKRVDSKAVYYSAAEV